MNTKRLLRLISVALLAFALFSTAPSLKAQSPEPQKPAPEVQQLKERLLQLEQVVDELKTQITSLEDSQKKPDAASGEKWHTVNDDLDLGGNATGVLEAFEKGRKRED